LGREYSKDFILIEDDVSVLKSKKFRHDVDLIIGRNSINQIDKTIYFSESIANSGRGEYQIKNQLTPVITSTNLS